MPSPLSLATHANPENAGTAASVGARAGGFGEFFRYHGWLSPGVRLFRAIGFRAKALCVSFAFVVPLLMALFFLWRAQTEQADFAASELRGLSYVRPMGELLVKAQELRRATARGETELGPHRRALQAAFDQVAARQAALGKEMKLSQGFDALQSLHAVVMQPPAGTGIDTAFRSQTDYIAAALSLIGNIADGSQLALDPELQTYHMMNMSVVRGPMQIEYAARALAMGELVKLDDARGKEIGASRHDLLTESLALWEFVEAEAANSFQVGIAATDAAAAREFDAKAARDAARTFREMVRSHVLGTSVQGDVAAFGAAGSAAIEAQLTLNRQVMTRLEAELEQRIERLKRQLFAEFATAGAFVCLAAYLLLAFYKVMMGGLQEVAGHLDQITRGNLTTAPTPWGRDEAARLMTSLGRMQGSLREVVARVLGSSEQVQTASREISSASLDLSQRTERSAASLEETAASMEQIASTVTTTSDTVAQASEIVQQNADAAARGGEVIGQVVATMNDIRASSSRIGEIIGVIDGIAFQTNILALNAAVEAARAGEQGRGFAVVATEVRALAARSAAAAREIKALIGTSMDKVEVGHKVVADAGRTISDIVGNAERIAGMMNEIATATREQSAGVGQVGAAIQELDQATQQNAALVEQSAAAAGSLSDQARRLAEQVAFFKLI